MDWPAYDKNIERLSGSVLKKVVLLFKIDTIETSVMYDVCIDITFKPNYELHYFHSICILSKKGFV